MIASRSCLTPAELAAYADTRTPSIPEVERHVETCEACRRAVAAFVRAGRPEPIAGSPVEPSEVTVDARPPGSEGTTEAIAPEAYTRATLRDEEIRTARTMIWTGRLLGVVALAPLPVLGGNVAVQVAFVSTVAIAIVAGVVVEQRLRDPRRYTEGTMLALGLIVVVAGLAAMLYYGIFSAAQLFPVLLLYFFSRRERFNHTLVLYGATAVGQAIVAAIVIGGVIEDPGVFRPVAPRELLIVGHVLIQIGHLAALVVGWQSRGDTRAAIDGMQHAMLVAARRQVLLEEVQADLARAIRVGGPGRYSGQQVGSYLLGNVLGRGGMGEVYEARHVTSDEPAAVKLLAPRELGNPHAIERFVREVRVVSTLTSPHVVRVLEASAEDDPIPYFAMERLYGQTLAEILRGAPSAQSLVEMLGEVGGALEEAWSHGIVHRDLKPHNLFLARRADVHVWKVLDFGVAILDDGGASLTRGHVIGTPAYMAPEQARGERVDHRADLYALAAIAYRWVTGRPAYSGNDARTVLYQVVHGSPLRPSALAPLHPDIDAALAIGLAKDPAQRWSQVAELRDAIAAALAGRLAPALRQRAADLVACHPWSTAPD